MKPSISSILFIFATLILIFIGFVRESEYLFTTRIVAIVFALALMAIELNK